MRKNKHLVFLILLPAIILSSWRLSTAQDAGDASSALCEYGIKLHKEGQIADAIHELKKALIINPHNLKAKNYLTKIYSERGLSVEPQPASGRKIRINEYEDQIKKLQEEANYYQKQLKALNDRNLAKEAELERLARELEFQKNLSGLKEQAHKNRQEKIAGLENQISRLEKETGDYQKQLAALNAQYLAKEAELEKLNQNLNSQKELMDRKERELLQAQKEKHLADLASKKKELAKLKADYENRLKLMETSLRTKENLMIDECLPAWTQEKWLTDDSKEEIPKLECEFDEKFLSTGTLEFAEKQELSSWEKLHQELQVLMPSLEDNLDEEDSFYTGDDKTEFQELKIEMDKDTDWQTIFSDLDK